MSWKASWHKRPHSSHTRHRVPLCAKTLITHKSRGQKDGRVRWNRCVGSLSVLLCPYITAQLMGLFAVLPQLNQSGTGAAAAYSPLGKRCSIGAAPWLTCQWLGPSLGPGEREGWERAGGGGERKRDNCSESHGRRVSGSGEYFLLLRLPHSGNLLS